MSVNHIYWSIYVDWISWLASRSFPKLINRSWLEIVRTVPVVADCPKAPHALLFEQLFPRLHLYWLSWLYRLGLTPGFPAIPILATNACDQYIVLSHLELDPPNTQVEAIIIRVIHGFLGLCFSRLKMVFHAESRWIHADSRFFHAIIFPRVVRFWTHRNHWNWIKWVKSNIPWFHWFGERVDCTEVHLYDIACIPSTCMHVSRNQASWPQNDFQRTLVFVTPHRFVLVNGTLIQGLRRAMGDTYLHAVHWPETALAPPIQHVSTGREPPKPTRNPCMKELLIKMQWSKNIKNTKKHEYFVLVGSKDPFPNLPAFGALRPILSGQRVLRKRSRSTVLWCWSSEPSWSVGGGEPCKNLSNWSKWYIIVWYVLYTIFWWFPYIILRYYN